MSRLSQPELIAEVRSLIGSPSPNQVHPGDLLRRIVSALDWLAGELGYAVKTEDRAVKAAASVYEYPLPRDFEEMIWVRYGGEMLTPASVFQWVRDGTDWIDASAALPTEYAIQERRLLVTPPPSSSNVTTYPHFSISYIAAPDGPDGTGTPLLGESDASLLAYVAASEWLAGRPSDENTARLAAFQGFIQARLQDARRRHRQRSQEYAPSVRVYSRRSGAYR